MLNYINIVEVFVRVEIIIFDKQLETDVYNDAFLHCYVLKRSYKLFHVLLNI